MSVTKLYKEFELKETDHTLAGSQAGGSNYVIPSEPFREPKFKWIAYTEAHSHWQRMCQ